MTKKTSKKRRSNNLTKQQNTIYLGICLFLLSIFLFLFLLVKNTGVMGKFVRSFLKGMFGFTGKLLPLILLMASFVLLFQKLRKNKNKYLIPILVFSVGIMLLFDTLNVSIGDSLRSHLKNSLIVSENFKGGGYIGAIIGHPVRKIFGDVGLYFLLLIGFVIQMLSIFKISKKDFVKGTEVYVNKLESKISKGVNKIKTTEKRTFVNPDKAFVDVNKSTDPFIEYSDVSDDTNLGNKTDEVNNIDYSEDINLERDFDINIADANFRETVYNDEDIANTLEEIPLFEEDIKTNDGEVISQLSVIDSDSNSNKERKYIYPPIELLKPPVSSLKIDNNILKAKANLIETTLKSFGISAVVENINRGPTVTVYELKPAIGVKISRITNLQDDLCLALSSRDIRIVAPIPGKSLVGIETPNDQKEVLYLRELIDSKDFKKIDDALPIALGKDINGKTIISTISDMPHLLIAGATGSGKSVCINSIILSILYKSSPDEVKMILIDPKVVELSIYNGIPHLLIPVVTDPKKAGSALSWAVTEMEKRYALFAKANARDFTGYNEKIGIENPDDKLKKLVIIIDELADLMLVSGKEVEESISRLAQMARAAGIYLIVATQRPSVDVITGTIKANIPSRISFAVSSQIDSRTILDMAGAEKLLGKGDMLFLHRSESSPTRIQGAFVSDKEIENIVSFIKLNNTPHDYDDQVEDEVQNLTEDNLDGDEELDELFNDAALLVVKDNQGSISYLQRRLKIGYSRAARIIDQMEARGIVGPYEGSKPRKVLVSLNELEVVLNGDK